jgi:hypothetical protein
MRTTLASAETLPRRRRFWLTEALIVAAVLAFGGFALLSDSRLSPAEFANSISDFVAR